MATLSPDSKLKEFYSKLKHHSWQPICELHEDHPCACKQTFYNTELLLQWGRERQDGSQTTNIECVLNEVKPIWPFEKPKPNLFEDARRSLRVFIILLGIDHEKGQEKPRNRKLIHIFQEYKICDEFLEKETQNYGPLKEWLRKTYGDTVRDRIIKHFDHYKWLFSVPSLKYNMEGDFHKRIMLPFCVRQPMNSGGTANPDLICFGDNFSYLADIQDRNRQANSHDMQEVLAAIVPESFVGPEMKAHLGPPLTSPKYGNCYKLAIKAYPDDQRRVFKSELDAFRAFKGLSQNPGLVKYFGSYNHHDGVGNPTYNILLEFGEMDLSKYFEKESPPEQSFEILDFWTSMLKVAEAIRDVHELCDDGGSLYNGWHGDVKPENILNILGARPKFKLADFGFFKFKKKLLEWGADQGTLPEVNMGAGTTAYGAPEAARAKLSNGKVGQKIDTWSFGCVLSVAVTWVVLGFKGVREYEALREKGQRGRDTPSHTFHDGNEPLLEIEHWHKHLKKAARRSDLFTSPLVHLIEKYLLREERSRITSDKLCDKLDDILKPYLDMRRDGVHPCVTEARQNAKFGSEKRSDEHERGRTSGQEDFYVSSRASCYSETATVTDHPDDRVTEDFVARGEIPEAAGSSSPFARTSTPVPIHNTSLSHPNILIPAIEVNAVPRDRHYEQSDHTSESQSTTITLPDDETSQGPQLRSISSDERINFWKAVEEKSDGAAWFCGQIVKTCPGIVEATDANGYTPLILAARAQNIPAMLELLPTSELSKKDPEGKTVLHYAVLMETRETPEFLKVIEDLMQRSEKALVNSRDTGGTTPLYLCMSPNNLKLKTAQILLKNDAWINPPPGVPKGDNDLLIVAISTGQKSMVELFINQEPRPKFDWDSLKAHCIDTNTSDWRGIKSLLERKYPREDSKKSRFFGRARY